MIKNRGTGAGGANTNKNGKSFEKSINIEGYLINNNYIKCNINKNKNGYYLLNKSKNKTIIYLSQYNMKKYFKQEYDIELCRNPDGCFIIKTKTKTKYTCDIYILEMKTQNCGQVLH